MDITRLSTDQLRSNIAEMQAEIERREQVIATMPVLNENIDFTQVIQVFEAENQKVAQDMDWLRDTRTIVFDVLAVAMYGDTYLKWRNALVDTCRGY